MEYVQLIVAALIPMVMGFLWYGPMLFQKSWMDAVGMTEEKAKEGNMPAIFGISFVMALMLAFFVSFLVRHDPAGLHPFVHGAFHGALIGLLAAVPVLVTNSLFEQRHPRGILINVGYWIVTIALMGGLLCAWQ